MDEQELAPDQFTHNNLQLNAPAGNKLLGQVLPNPLTAQQQLFLITSEQKNFHFNPLVGKSLPRASSSRILLRSTAADEFSSQARVLGWAYCARPSLLNFLTASFLLCCCGSLL